jgi:hypothetical protein
MMDDILFYLTVASPFLIVFAMLFVSQVIKRRRERKLTEFAVSQGWVVKHSWGITGPGNCYVIRPKNEAGWELRIRRRATGWGSFGSASSVPGRAEFRADQPRFANGFVLFAYNAGYRRSARAVAFLTRVFGLLVGRPVARWFYGREMGDNLRALKHFESPEGIDLAIFATSDPRGWFDLELISNSINKLGAGRRARPSVQIGNRFIVVDDYGVEIPGSGEEFLAECIELQSQLIAKSPTSR